MTGAGRRVPRVVALIEPHPCTLAAVAHAAALAERRGGPLVVAYVASRPPTIQTGWFCPPPVDYDALESEMFTRAARILAPSGASWSFVSLNGTEDMSAVWLRPGLEYGYEPGYVVDAAGNAGTVLVRVRHDRRHRRILRPRDRVGRALARLGSGAPVTRVIDCAGERARRGTGLDRGPIVNDLR